MATITLMCQMLVPCLFALPWSRLSYLVSYGGTGGNTLGEYGGRGIQVVVGRGRDTGSGREGEGYRWWLGGGGIQVLVDRGRGTGGGWEEGYRYWLVGGGNRSSK